jgi:hypothetical protein
MEMWIGRGVYAASRADWSTAIGCLATAERMYTCDDKTLEIIKILRKRYRKKQKLEKERERLAQIKWGL